MGEGKIPYHTNELIPTKWKPPILTGQLNTYKIILPNYYKRIQMLTPTFSQGTWTRADLQNTWVEPWYKGNFSSNDTLGFPYSLSLLRYMGVLPRPNEVLALCLELLGKK